MSSWSGQYFACDRQVGSGWVGNLSGQGHIKWTRGHLRGLRAVRPMRNA